jgi:hypothetical protein
LVISVELESRKSNDRLYKGCLDCLKVVHSDEFEEIYENLSCDVLARDLLYYNLKTGKISGDLVANETISIGVFFPDAINVLVSNIDKRISELLIKPIKSKLGKDDIDDIIGGRSVFEEYDDDSVAAYLEDFLMSFSFSDEKYKGKFLPWFVDRSSSGLLLSDTITESVRSKLSDKFWKKLKDPYN